MQTVNIKAYWHMVHAWVVKFFVSLPFVYPYQIMLRLETV